MLSEQESNATPFVKSMGSYESKAPFISHLPHKKFAFRVEQRLKGHGHAGIFASAGSICNAKVSFTGAKWRLVDLTP